MGRPNGSCRCWLGLHELIPWLRQWHNDVDPDIGQGLGDYYADYLAAEMQRHGLGAGDLAAWRPPSPPHEVDKRTAESGLIDD